MVSRDRGSRSPTSNLPPAPFGAPPAYRADVCSLQVRTLRDEAMCLPSHTSQRGEDRSIPSMPGLASSVNLKVPEPGWVSGLEISLESLDKNLLKMDVSTNSSCHFQSLGRFTFWLALPLHHGWERQMEKMSGKDWPDKHFENRQQLQL